MPGGRLRVLPLTVGDGFAQAAGEFFGAEMFDLFGQHQVALVALAALFGGGGGVAIAIDLGPDRQHRLGLGGDQRQFGIGGRAGAGEPGQGVAGADRQQAADFGQQFGQHDQRGARRGVQRQRPPGFGQRRTQRRQPRLERAKGFGILVRIGFGLGAHGQLLFAGDEQGIMGGVRWGVDKFLLGAWDAFSSPGWDRLRDERVLPPPVPAAIPQAASPAFCAALAFPGCGCGTSYASSVSQKKGISLFNN